jgi:Ca2+-binding EF-hand superfamily protein
MRKLVSAYALMLAMAAGDPALAQRARSSDDAMLASALVWDANADGIYTCDEWKAFITKVFTDADKNRDGFLDRQEFAAVKAADPQFKEADLGYFDDNRDGKLSRAEFIDRPTRLFVKFDKNRDCKVTPEEIGAVQSAEMEKNRARALEGANRPLR